MLTLHFTPKTVAAAVAITLNEVGADYELKKVDFAASEQKSPDYLKINPKGRVPALITDQGVLTETIALLEYVNALYDDLFGQHFPRQSRHGRSGRALGH